MTKLTIYQRIIIFLTLYPWIMSIIFFIFLIVLRLLFADCVYAEEVSTKTENTHEKTIKYFKIGGIFVIGIASIIFYKYALPLSSESTDIANINYEIATISIMLPEFIPKMCLNFVTDIYDFIKKGSRIRELPDNALKEPIMFLKSVYLHLFSLDEYHERLTVVLNSDTLKPLTQIIQILRSCQTTTKVLLDKQIFFNLGLVHTAILENNGKLNLMSPFMNGIFNNRSQYDVLCNQFKSIGAQLVSSNNNA